MAWEKVAGATERRHRERDGMEVVLPAYSVQGTSLSAKPNRAKEFVSVAPNYHVNRVRNRKFA